MIHIRLNIELCIFIEYMFCDNYLKAEKENLLKRYTISHELCKFISKADEFWYYAVLGPSTRYVLIYFQIFLYKSISISFLRACLFNLHSCILCIFPSGFYFFMDAFLIQVKSLLADAKAGVPFSALENSTNANALSINPLPSLFPAASTPPLSPRSSSGSPRTMKQRTSPSSLGSPLKVLREPVREIIPQVFVIVLTNHLFFFVKKYWLCLEKINSLYGLLALLWMFAVLLQKRSSTSKWNKRPFRVSSW